MPGVPSKDDKPIVDPVQIYRITSTLFELLKFFDPVGDSSYTPNKRNSVCHYVMSRLGKPPLGYTPQIYWGFVSDAVKACISRTRSNKTHELKKAFYRKLFVACVIIFII